jgi:hypothetical protein
LVAAGRFRKTGKSGVIPAESTGSFSEMFQLFGGPRRSPYIFGVGREIFRFPAEYP